MVKKPEKRRNVENLVSLGLCRKIVQLNRHIITVEVHNITPRLDATPIKGGRFAIVVGSRVNNPIDISNFELTTTMPNRKSNGRK
jgi:hypothetical protein